jgi:hypothetical protein
VNRKGKQEPAEAIAARRERVVTILVSALVEIASKPKRDAVESAACEGRAAA